MSILDILRKEPNMHDTAQSFAKRPAAELSPETIQALESIRATSAERDALRLENAALNSRIDNMTREIDLLRAHLDDAERKRDFYQRHSVSLHTRLSDIFILIQQATSEALAEARAASATSGNAPATNTEETTQ